MNISDTAATLIQVPVNFNSLLKFQPSSLCPLALPDGAECPDILHLTNLDVGANLSSLVLHLR